MWLKQLELRGILGEVIGGGDIDGGREEISKDLSRSHYKNTGLSQSKTGNRGTLLTRRVK